MKRPGFPGGNPGRVSYDYANGTIWGVERRRKGVANSLHAYLDWRNANPRGPKVLAAERKRRAEMRAERTRRWGRPAVRVA